MTKYERKYKTIIKNAKTRDPNFKGEWHHILPRCMGGTNDPKNLVKLTYREHYQCHYLLMKMNPHNKSLSLAFVLMSEDDHHGNILSLEDYERCKQLNSEYKSEYMSEYMLEKWKENKEQMVISINKNKCLYSMWKYLCTYNLKPTKNVLLKGWKLCKGFSTVWRKYYTEDEWIKAVKFFLKENPIDSKKKFNKKQSHETITRRNQSIIFYTFINLVKSEFYGFKITRDIALNCYGKNGKLLKWRNHFSTRQWLKKIKEYWKNNNMEKFELLIND